jgi:hypothetical protein
MGLATFSIYKYVRTLKGWRYCRAAYAPKRKIKPNVVVVAGKEELHPEGSYYLNVGGHWDKVGDSADQAQEEKTKRLARQRYEKDTGEKPPEPEPDGELLSDAIAAYVGEPGLKVKRHRGSGHPPTPATPPCVRNRTRRFGGLSRSQVARRGRPSASK